MTIVLILNLLLINGVFGQPYLWSPAPGAIDIQTNSTLSINGVPYYIFPRFYITGSKQEFDVTTIYNPVTNFISTIPNPLKTVPTRACWCKEKTSVYIVGGEIQIQGETRLHQYIIHFNVLENVEDTSFNVIHPSPSIASACIIRNNVLYNAGGIDTSRLASYNLVTKQWNRLSAMPVSLSYTHTTAEWEESNAIMLLGGYDSNNKVIENIFIYFIGNNTWTQVFQLPLAHAVIMWTSPSTFLAISKINSKFQRTSTMYYYNLTTFSLIQTLTMDVSCDTIDYLPTVYQDGSTLFLASGLLTWDSTPTQYSTRFTRMQLYSDMTTQCFPLPSIPKANAYVSMFVIR